MFKNILKCFGRNYGLFIVLPVVILIAWFILYGSDFLDRGPRLTVYDDVKISAFQPDEFFSAVEDSELVESTLMGRIVVKRHISAKHRGRALFSAMIIPYRHIPKGEMVKLFIVRYIYNDLGTVKNFLIVE